MNELQLELRDIRSFLELAGERLQKIEKKIQGGHEDPEIRPSIKFITQVVAQHFGITRTELLSHQQLVSLARPRHIAMYLAKKMTLHSLAEIGRRIGDRDHTTVLHGVNKIKEKIDDPETVELLEKLKSIIESTHGAKQSPPSAPSGAVADSAALDQPAAAPSLSEVGA